MKISIKSMVSIFNEFTIIYLTIFNIFYPSDYHWFCYLSSYKNSLFWHWLVTIIIFIYFIVVNCKQILFKINPTMFLKRFIIVHYSKKSIVQSFNRSIVQSSPHSLASCEWAPIRPQSFNRSIEYYKPAKLQMFTYPTAPALNCF